MYYCTKTQTKMQKLRNDILSFLIPAVFFPGGILIGSAALLYRIVGRKNDKKKKQKEVEIKFW